ncbi:hypothetical protein HK439_06860 [Labrenzia aggregata]|uniref:Leucine-rich repeat-containing N-terminal plant-type domain-containing protein n=1 Tax=Roseibium aggregatum TaxID=187304 RepID=A0A926S512_9HYPH|nr:hypothetical protein [Roseibium aggregatum]
MRSEPSRLRSWPSASSSPCSFSFAS